MQADTGDASAEGGLTEGWRAALRAFLLDQINEPPVMFGEILDRFGPTIPRHEVERAWHRRHPDDTRMVAPNTKLSDLVHSELHRYRLEVVGLERSHGRRWTRDTGIRAIGRACAVCQIVYIGNRPTSTCSTACANRNRPPRISAIESVPRNGERKMASMATARHPELVAIETIFETLRRLPDHDARERVLTYAKHLVETAEETAPEPSQHAGRTNGVASDATL